MALTKKEARESYLMNLLHSKGRITTNEAVAMLDISEATARRMFSSMAKTGKIVRNYGGIQLVGSSHEYSFEINKKSFTAEKRQIGSLAASLVEDGDTIYLDCGTTIFHMTLGLNERIANGELHSLNIITNSIANVQSIMETQQCRVVLVGGEYSHKRQDFSGPLTEKWIAPFHFTKCFLGTDGVTSQHGFSSNQFSISSLNAYVIKQSKQAYVLLDRSKFDKSSLVSYAQLNEVHMIVTNSMPEAPLLKAMQNAKLNVLTVDQS